MASTDVEICNASLLMVGADEINSFSDATTEAKLCNAIYLDTKHSYLQSYPWRFSLRQSDLQGALSTDPVFEWERQYQLPIDLLRLIRMENSANYEVFGKRLYTDETTAKIIYQADVSEANLPAYFIRAFQYKLCVIFAASLAEDLQKVSVFEDLANKENIRARNIDSQSQPPRDFPDAAFSMLNVRQR